MSRPEPVHILLVEDNEADVQIIRMAMDGSGLVSHELELCMTGSSAMKRLQEGPAPDLTILDLNLPGVDGDELLALFKELPSLHGIPVVILSSSRAPRDVRLASEIDSCMYLTKPFDLDQFLAIGPQIRQFWEKTRPSKL